MLLWVRFPSHEEVSLERLARLTTGMSGADLANLVNEAALCAARRSHECVTGACFEEVLARALMEREQLDRAAFEQLVST